MTLGLAELWELHGLDVCMSRAGMPSLLGTGQQRGWQGVHMQDIITPTCPDARLEEVWKPQISGSGWLGCNRRNPNSFWT